MQSAYMQQTPSLVPPRRFLFRRWDSLVLCDLGCMHAHIDSSISSLHLGPWPPAARKWEGRGQSSRLAALAGPRSGPISVAQRAFDLPLRRPQEQRQPHSGATATVHGLAGRACAPLCLMGEESQRRPGPARSMNSMLLDCVHSFAGGF